MWSNINVFLELQTFLRPTACLWSLMISDKTFLQTGFPCPPSLPAGLFQTLIQVGSKEITVKQAYDRLGWLIHNYNMIRWVIDGDQSCIHSIHIIDKIIKIPGRGPGGIITGQYFVKPLIALFGETMLPTDLQNVS